MRRYEDPHPRKGKEKLKIRAWLEVVKAYGDSIQQGYELTPQLQKLNINQL